MFITQILDWILINFSHHILMGLIRPDPKLFAIKIQNYLSSRRIWIFFKWSTALICQFKDQYQLLFLLVKCCTNNQCFFQALVGCHAAADRVQLAFCIFAKILSSYCWSVSNKIITRQFDVCSWSLRMKGWPLNFHAVIDYSVPFYKIAQQAEKFIVTKAGNI